jgi:tartronate-semialdehyde synthase
MLLAAAKKSAKRSRKHPDFAAMRAKFIKKPGTKKPVAETGLDPREVFEAINQKFEKLEDTQWTTGCGITQIWSGQWQRINKPRRYFPSGGAGTLGFDIPAAIGASAATGRKTCCMMGDFGFTFMPEELGVAAAYNLPVIVFIINNAYLGLIRQNQKGAYGYEYQVAFPENKKLVDYVKIAEGFACKAERVFNFDQLDKAMDKAIACKGPYVIDIICDDYQNCDMGNDIAHIKHWD